MYFSRLHFFILLGNEKFIFTIFDIGAYIHMKTFKLSCCFTFALIFIFSRKY